MVITQVLLARIVFQVKAFEKRRQHQQAVLPLITQWDTGAKDIGTPNLDEGGLHIRLDDQQDKNSLYRANSQPASPRVSPPRPLRYHPYQTLHSGPSSPEAQKDRFEFIAEPTKMHQQAQQAVERAQSYSSDYVSDVGLRPLSDDWEPPATWNT